MKVKNLLEAKGKDVVSMDAGSSVEDAIRVMNSRKISAMMVTDRSRSIGIFTERDVVKCYLSNEGRIFKDIVLRDAMTTDLIVAQMDDDLNDIMSVMVEKNIRHLPVVGDGNVIGMLSIRDVIQTQVGKLTSEIHYLKDYITGSYT
jgi:CBS domain-containing protein